MRLNVCVGILNDVYRCVHSLILFGIKLPQKKKKQPSKFLAPFFLSTAVSIYLANLRIKFMDSRGVILRSKRCASIYAFFIVDTYVNSLCRNNIYTREKSFCAHMCGSKMFLSLSLSLYKKIRNFRHIY
jgi:hypothetical protein